MVNVGRPLMFQNVDELEKLIVDYFDNITITYPLTKSEFDGKDEEGNDIFKQVPLLNNAGNQVYRTDYLENPSIIGLARHLGTTRKTLLDYEERSEFSYTIKKAKERIEQYLEEQLYRKEQVTGIIFNLKNNFLWKDKQEVEHSGEQTYTIKLPSDLDGD